MHKQTNMPPQVAQLHNAALQAELSGFHAFARAIRVLIAAAMTAAVTGCVTELPRDASPAVQEGYNRARYGNPTVATPAHR